MPAQRLMALHGEVQQQHRGQDQQRHAAVPEGGEDIHGAYNRMTGHARLRHLPRGPVRQAVRAAPVTA
ncbi:hypothetical protein GCM10010448_27400 [Streptomyces glomeratus]|uniref:Uncharacterized protein n=1 Tax=Streptomyces glomeratus TaxID=284452 RepID=A0ABP6LK86_9ACTN